ncbi:MAG: DUF3160 domain-containing protein, partial [Planctomycetes bacterium]|nr:DUF3160 domain-containing protein [Planctomycetota bacterium]
MPCKAPAGSESFSASLTPSGRRQTIAAAILTKLLTTGQAADNRKLSDVWQRIYAVTAYYVGVADDLSFTDYAEALAKVIGKDLDAAKLLDDDKFFAAKVELAKLRGPAIYSGTGNVTVTDLAALAGKPSPEVLAKVLDVTMGLRVMGQRFVPDSYAMGKMVFPTVNAPTGGGLPWSLGDVGTGPRRAFPRSLDVMSVFGSDKAGELLKNIGDTAYTGYEEAAGELRGEFDKLSALDWNRNLYWSWIWSLKGLNTPVAKGYPSFMQTGAWQDRQLYATSASWSQLRHDTILYAKQSYTSHTKGMPHIPKDVPGYVEPSAEFYGRLLALNHMTIAGLNQMKVLDETANKRLASLDAIIQRLLDISVKELANKELAKDDYD